ncbi:MAG: hypothetical protein LVQ96_08470 [Thermoplasmatales archaeon]|nr:hypothetical protein [Thermoplasmatales archaeon]MCW6171183.1 hypothetical protein [Thermoplasmatales archaeon]
MEMKGKYSIGDLDSRSWPKFEELFNKYNGVQSSCWCVYYHRKLPIPRIKRGEERVSNHDLKKKLIEEGKSRSVLVYYNESVVASCQYGTFEELPRIENSQRYSNLRITDDNAKKWRITCFFVDTHHRHIGVAKFALDGVLERIARNGGGLVEAYPVKWKGAYELWFGSIHMFTERGFRVVSDFGKNNVLVRRNIVSIRILR